MKVSKVRRTDFRPTAARVPDGLDHLSEANRREQAAHDKQIAGHGEQTLRAIGADLGRRRCSDRKDPEHRWVMHRLAAVGRALSKLSQPIPTPGGCRP